VSQKKTKVHTVTKLTTTLSMPPIHIKQDAWFFATSTSMLCSQHWYSM